MTGKSPKVGNGITTAIYHVTHLQNLPSIVAAGGLFCDQVRAEQGVGCIGIAHQHIKERRGRRNVPTCRGGTLADYVPFYFAPRSPMLFAINAGNVAGYDEGQRPVLHLVSSAQAVAAAELAFTFTDGHAEMEYSEFFEDLGDLRTKIDWSVMRSRYWNDDPPQIIDRKRKRQAEFLVHQFFPWNLIQTIGVIDQITLQSVRDILVSATHRPEIRVARNWYY